jgi:hypothetical protein
MSSHRLSAAAVALLGILVASATPSPRLVMRQPAQPAGSAPLLAFGGRSADQLARGIGGKLDATLAGLARSAGRARAGHALEDLHSLSPAAHFRQSEAGAGALVAVDAVTRGDPQQLKEALVSLGLEHPAVFRNDVGGWLPVSAIESAAARDEVASVRAALWHTRGVVATQGDYVQGTYGLRATYPTVDGSGVTVGILSDSYDCYAVYAANQGTTVGGVPDPPASGPTGYASNGFTADAETDVSTGALPASVNVLEEAGGTFGQAGSQGCIADFGYPLQLPFADEGRAMLQIVHAVAPGASLAFYTASNSEADFANGIQALATAGAKVIADDVGYFDEPFFQDGLVTQAIDTVQTAGVAYFSAAGNNGGTLGYDNLAPKFTIAGSGAQAGEMLLNFDTTGATSTSVLTINVPSLVQGEFIAAVVEWDQPYLTGAPPGTSGSTPGATSQIDLCVTAPAGDEVLNYTTGAVVTCTGPNAVGVDPLQVLIVANPANAAGNSTAGTASIMVGLVNGSPAPGRIKVVWEDNGAGSAIVNFPQPDSATIQGHPGAAGAAAVGAAFFLNTAPCGLVGTTVLNGYSSFGGSPILFDYATGARLATPVVRQKPDFVGPDGTNTSFFGFTLASASIQDNSTVLGCANNASYPNYFGTSAATPHAAGMAALMLQTNASLTPTQIITAMQKGAAPMDNPSPDLKTGYGFLQAEPALAAVPPGPPTISVSPTSITVGQSATVTWNAINVTSCTGSGSLSTSTTSGSMNVMPASTGSYTYTLTCKNAAGTNKASATLTVSAMSSSGGGGGGGALGGVTLLMLAGLLLARLFLYSASASTSANTKPSRSTTSPTRTAIGAANIGPADTTV